MKIERRIMIVVVALLGALVSISSAQDLRPAEVEIIDMLADENAFAADVASHDPFKPVIEKKQIVIRIEQEKKERGKTNIETKIPVIEPLKLDVTGICGNSLLRQAIITHENQEYTFAAGDKIEGKFSVIEVKPEEVVIYSTREERRRVFRLSSTK